MGYDVKQKIDTNAKIAVLMGGPSSEAEISRRSGKNIFKALQNLGYKNAELIEVDENIAATLRTKNIEFVYNAMHGRFGEGRLHSGNARSYGHTIHRLRCYGQFCMYDKEYTKNILKEAGIPLIKSDAHKKGDGITKKK